MLNDLFKKNQDCYSSCQFLEWNSSNILLLMAMQCHFPIEGFDTWSNHL